MPDLLSPVIELVTGGLKGVSTVFILFFAYRWLQKGAVLGFIMTMGAYFFGFLAVLSVLGIVDVNLGVLADLVGAALDAIGGMLTVATPAAYRNVLEQLLLTPLEMIETAGRVSIKALVESIAAVLAA